MTSTQEEFQEFRRQLASGAMRKTYRALLGFMSHLRTRFTNQHPNSSISGLYQGTLDMTYFAVVPPRLKMHGLKIAIVFNYDAFRFEAWLAASNRQIQRQYWQLIQDSRWADYRVVTPATGVDAIVECVLADGLDFADLDRLSAGIEDDAARFIAAVERFISELESTGVLA